MPSPNPPCSYGLEGGRRTFCNEFYLKCSQIEQQAMIINLFHNEPANSSKLFTFNYLFCCKNDKCEVEWRGKVWGTYAYARFKNTFRISRTTFVYILNRIKHQLERKTIAEDPIEPDLLLGLRLYRLGIGAYYYTIAEMVGLCVFTGFFYCSRSVVNSYRTIVADAISIDICHNHERKLRKRLWIWRSSGSFLAAGLQLTAATFPQSVLLEVYMHRKSTITLKIFTPLFL